MCFFGLLIRRQSGFHLVGYLGFLKKKYTKKFWRRTNDPQSEIQNAFFSFNSFKNPFYVFSTNPCLVWILRFPGSTKYVLSGDTLWLKVRQFSVLPTSTANQPKSQVLFHRNVSPPDLYWFNNISRVQKSMKEFGPNLMWLIYL